MTVKVDVFNFTPWGEVFIYYAYHISHRSCGVLW
jgi:hypothetical protein